MIWNNLILPRKFNVYRIAWYWGNFCMFQWHCSPDLHMYTWPSSHVLCQGWHWTCQLFCLLLPDHQHHLQLIYGWKLGQLALFQAQILSSGLLELSKTGELIFTATEVFYRSSLPLRFAFEFFFLFSGNVLIVLWVIWFRVPQVGVTLEIPIFEQVISPQMQC